MQKCIITFHGLFCAANLIMTMFAINVNSAQVPFVSWRTMPTTLTLASSLTDDSFTAAGTERGGLRCRYSAQLAVENLAATEQLRSMQMKSGK